MWEAVPNYGQKDLLFANRFSADSKLRPRRTWKLQTDPNFLSAQKMIHPSTKPKTATHP